MEHGGRTIVTFDVPQVQFRGTKTGKSTRTYFSNPVGNGNLKITVTSKGWMSETTAEQRYQDDRRAKRASQYSRLNPEVEIRGALKTLTYTTEDPYVGQAVVIYTPDFRCELLVTGTNEAAALVEETYQQLLSTLRVVPRTKIGELEIGD